MNEGDGDYTYDGSGNQNHGTITGATWDTANTDIAQVGLVRQNSPMVFDGSDDEVDCGTSALISGGSACTLSFWMISNDNVDARAVINQWNSGGYSNWGVWAMGSGIIQFHDGVSANLSSASAYNNDGNWYHVVVTKDGTAIKFYVDGSLHSSATSSGSTIDNNGVENTFIGSKQTGDYFDGLINEVAIWDEALDADAVTALYNSGTPLDATTDSGNYDNSGDLQGYWRNDNDTTWTDRSTNSNDGTVAGSPDSIVLTEGLTSGRDSQGFFLTDTTENCLTLNGAEYVETDSILTTIGTDTSGTVEMWVRPVDSTPSAHLKVFSIDDTDVNTSFFLQLRTDGMFRAMVKNAGTNQWYIETDSAELSSGTWHHIVLSQDGTEPVLYIDGDVPSQTFPVTTDKTAWLNDLSGVDNVIIGASNVNSNGYANFFDGDIDDFRYYSNKALSASEVTKNYNAGKSKH
jgi:hypothetical protein